jgi:hypothetical protein
VAGVLPVALEEEFAFGLDLILEGLTRLKRKPRERGEAGS